MSRAKLMAKGFADNASLLPNPNPALTVFNNQIVVTDTAQVAVAHGGKGIAAARDVQLGILFGMMMSELGYLQSLADNATPEEAVSILHWGGVEIAGVPLHEKAILTVSQGVTPGSVNLEANAKALLGDFLRRKHFFNWAYTFDGKTFVGLPSTGEARTTATGLTPLTLVGFRVCVTKAKGVMDPWSQVVDFLVH
jgi:hypothetical protein